MSNKFFNKNILKSMVIAAMVFSVIGFVVGIVYNYTTPGFEESISKTFNNYFVIALGLLVLTYIAQVLWLQKPASPDASESINTSETYDTHVDTDLNNIPDATHINDVLNNTNTFNTAHNSKRSDIPFSVNVFAVVAAILVLINTRFGSTGSAFSAWNAWTSTEPDFFTLRNMGFAIIFLTILVLSLVVLVKQNDTILIALIFLTAFHSVVSSQGFMAGYFPLLYTFAYIESQRIESFKSKGSLEILFLGLYMIVSMLASLISLGFVYQSAGWPYILFVSIFCVMSIISAVLFIYAWNKNKFKLFIAGALVYIGDTLARIIMQIISYGSYGVADIEGYPLMEEILYMVENLVTSPILIFCIIAFYKMGKRRKNMQSAVDHSSLPINDYRSDVDSESCDGQTAINQESISDDQSITINPEPDKEQLSSKSIKRKIIILVAVSVISYLSSIIVQFYPVTYGTEYETSDSFTVYDDEGYDVDYNDEDYDEWDEE